MASTVLIPILVALVSPVEQSRGGRWCLYTATLWMVRWYVIGVVSGTGTIRIPRKGNYRGFSDDQSPGLRTLGISRRAGFLNDDEVAANAGGAHTSEARMVWLRNVATAFRDGVTQLAEGKTLQLCPMYDKRLRAMPFRCAQRLRSCPVDRHPVLLHLDQVF